MLREDLTQSIIGAAMAVLNKLKPGLDEKLYENALVIERRAGGHTVEPQRQFPVYYREQWIGTLHPVRSALLFRTDCRSVALT